MKGSPVAMKDEDRWRAESDHRTLMDAADIQADATRMTGVRRHHKKVEQAHARVGRALQRKGRR